MSDISKNNRDYLVKLAKRKDIPSTKFLNGLYVIELRPLLDKLYDEKLPNKEEYNIMEKILDEVDEMDHGHLEDTIISIGRVKKFYPIIKKQRYIDSLERKHRKLRKEDCKCRDPKRREEIGKELSHVSDELYKSYNDK